MGGGSVCLSIHADYTCTQGVQICAHVHTHTPQLQNALCVSNVGCCLGTELIKLILFLRVEGGLAYHVSIIVPFGLFATHIPKRKQKRHF